MRPYTTINNSYENNIMGSAPPPMQPKLIGDTSLNNPYLEPSPTELSVVSDPFSGGQGIMGGQPIIQYLQPFLNQVTQQNASEMLQKIDPYVQEVQELTDRTFPNLNLSGGIGSVFGGGINSLEETPYNPATDFMTPGMGSYSLGPKRSQTQGIGSLFGSSNNFNSFRS